MNPACALAGEGANRILNIHMTNPSVGNSEQSTSCADHDSAKIQGFATFGQIRNWSILKILYDRPRTNI